MNKIIEQFQEIAAAVLVAAESPHLDETLEQIAHISRDLVGAKYAALGVPDARGQMKYFKTSGMPLEEILKIPHPPIGKGLLGAIIHERETIRLENFQDDPRSSGFPENHPPMYDLLGVPVQLSNQLFGMLYLCDRKDGLPFDENDQWLVETLAGYAALAMIGSELTEQQARLRLLEDRERIAMELHDGVIQSLYAIGLRLDLIRSSEAIQPDDMLPVMDALNQVIGDIRQYIVGLSEEDRATTTVYQSLVELSNRYYVPDMLTIEINAPEIPPPVSPAVFEGIGLIVNEALSNSIRHAEAQHIEIRASVVGRDFFIHVIDDGKGFDPEVMIGSKGLGLQNMHKRARLYDGQIEIQSSPGEGTHLTVRTPIGK